MRFAKPYKRLQASGEPTMRYPAETIEAMRKDLLGYRDNMRVVVEHDIPVNAKTVADLRALATWPSDLILEIHVDLDPRLSVVRVERNHS
jgi:hypothetical protein